MLCFHGNMSIYDEDLSYNHTTTILFDLIWQVSWRFRGFVFGKLEGTMEQLSHCLCALKQITEVVESSCEVPCKCRRFG